MTLTISNEEIKAFVTMADTIDILEEADGELAAGRGVIRRRSDILVPADLPRAEDSARYSRISMDGVVPKVGQGGDGSEYVSVSEPSGSGTTPTSESPCQTPIKSSKGLYSMTWVSFIYRFSKP